VAPKAGRERNFPKGNRGEEDNHEARQKEGSSGNEERRKGTARRDPYLLRKLKKRVAHTSWETLQAKEREPGSKLRR